MLTLLQLSDIHFRKKPEELDEYSQSLSESVNSEVYESKVKEISRYLTSIKPIVGRKVQRLPIAENWGCVTKIN